jgi:hypothetical protein
MGRDYPLPWDEPVEESKAQLLKKQRAIIRRYKKVEKRRKLLGAVPSHDNFEYYRPGGKRLELDPTYF